MQVEMRAGSGASKTPPDSLRGSAAPIANAVPLDGSERFLPPNISSQQNKSWVSKVVIPPQTSAGDQIIIDLADGVSILFTVPDGAKPGHELYVNDRGKVTEPGNDGVPGEHDPGFFAVEVKIPEYVYGQPPPSDILTVEHPDGGPNVTVHIPPGSKPGSTLKIQVPTSRRATALLDGNERLILEESWVLPVKSEINVTDTHIRVSTVHYFCCCCCRSEHEDTREVEIAAINGVSTTQPQNAGCPALFAVYFVWLFGGIFGYVFTCLFSLSHL